MISLIDLDFCYQQEILFQQLNLTFEVNQFHSIIGKNGSGKSTLIKLIAGLLDANNGFIEKPKNLNLCYIPADFDFYLNFNIADLIVIFQQINKGNAKLDSNLLFKVLLQGLALDRKVHSLSSGEKKRLIFYLNLLSCPDVLLIDEPDANLDPNISYTIFELLHSLLDEITIICVTHNINLAIKNSQKYTYISSDKRVYQSKKLTKNLFNKINEELLSNFEICNPKNKLFLIPK